jgi:hypothetical protein
MFVFNLFPAAAAGWRAHPGGPAALKQAMLVSRVEPWGFFIVMALVVPAWWAACGCNP